MSNATYMCKICKQLFKGGSNEVILDCKSHANEIHKIDTEKELSDRNLYEDELFDLTKQLREKYPKWSSSFMNLFEEKTKQAKKWICPKCNEKMGYNSKWYHTQNAKKYCVPKGEKKT